MVQICTHSFFNVYLMRFIFLYQRKYKLFIVYFLFLLNSISFNKKRNLLYSFLYQLNNTMYIFNSCIYRTSKTDVITKSFISRVKERTCYLTLHCQSVWFIALQGTKCMILKNCSFLLHFILILNSFSKTVQIYIKLAKEFTFL